MILFQYSLRQMVEELPVVSSKSWFITLLFYLCLAIYLYILLSRLPKYQLSNCISI